MLHALERVMIRRAPGFWWRATALHAATRCVMCRKRGGGSTGLTPSPMGPACRDHFTPETVADFEAAARERTGQ